MIIIVDAMGGDNAPESMVNGCIDAVAEAEGFDILMVGDSKRIEEIIERRKARNDRLKIYHATEVITGNDPPAKAIRVKKDSSMVVGMKLLKEKKGDVFISAGNTGALVVASTFILKRIPGVQRPALAALVPTKTGVTMIIDAGANTVCKPSYYLQFGIMGSIYMKNMFNIENPKVGLLNVGSEAGKGNDTIKQAYSLLSESDINFIGNVEGKDLTEGKADVMVCDGFSGNVMLKLLEGAADFFFSSIKDIYKKNMFSKLSALMIKKDLKKLAKRLDEDANGGAYILGVNGLVMKTHGGSSSKTVKHVILKAFNSSNASFVDEIREVFKNMQVGEIEDEE